MTQSGQDLKGTRTAVAVVNEEGSVGGGCKFELVERDHKWRAVGAAAVPDALDYWP